MHGMMDTFFSYLNSSQFLTCPSFWYYCFYMDIFFSPPLNALAEPALIAKSSILLDVKPWDDETDMAKLEECVRSIELDGLVWGQCKSVVLIFVKWKAILLPYLTWGWEPGYEASPGLHVFLDPNIINRLVELVISPWRGEDWRFSRVRVVDLFE